MRILTPEETAQLKTKPPGRVSAVRVALKNMQVGQTLFIEKAEWKRKKNSPAVLCRRMERRTTLKYVVERMVDGTGWVVRREK